MTKRSTSDRFMPLVKGTHPYDHKIKRSTNDRFSPLIPDTDVYTDSCAGRCEMQGNERVRENCSCVKLCFVSGTCCPDLADRCPLVKQEAEKVLTPRLMQPVATCDVTIDTYVVDTCLEPTNHSGAVDVIPDGLPTR